VCRWAHRAVGRPCAPSLTCMNSARPSWTAPHSPRHPVHGMCTPRVRKAARHSRCTASRTPSFGRYAVSPGRGQRRARSAGPPRHGVLELRQLVGRLGLPLVERGDVRDHSCAEADLTSGHRGHGATGTTVVITTSRDHVRRPRRRTTFVRCRTTTTLPSAAADDHRVRRSPCKRMTALPS
jgi:hypothetical protein